jgi:hypothetical protein
VSFKAGRNCGKTRGLFRWLGEAAEVRGSINRENDSDKFEFSASVEI